MMDQPPTVSGNRTARSLFTNSAYLFFGILISNISVFCTNIFLARTLPKTEYGTLILVHYIINIVVLLANFGIPEAATTLIAGARGENDKPRTAAVVNAAVKLTCATSLVFTVFQVLLAGCISRQVSTESAENLIRLTALWIVPFFISVLGSSIIEGFQQMRYSYRVRNLFEPLKFVIIIALYGASALTVRNIYLFWTAGYLVYGAAILLFLSVFFKRNGILLRAELHLRDVRWYKRFVPYYLPFIAPLLINMILPVFIVKMHSTVEVANFSVVMPFISLAPIFFSAVSRALLPAISHQYGQAKETLDNLNVILFKFLGLLNCLLFFVVIYNHQLIIRLIFGTRYLSAGSVLVVLVLAAFFENFKFILDPLLKGTRHVHVVLRLDYLRLVLLFAAGYFLIGRYGALGAAYTLCLINIPALALKLWFVRSRLKLDFAAIAGKEFIFIAAIGLAFYYDVNMYVTFAIFTALVLSSRIIRRQDLKMLFELRRT